MKRIVDNKIVVTNLIRIYTVCILIVNLLRIFGCVDFRFSKMQDIFYASSLFLSSVLIFDWYKEKEKPLLLGVLVGSVASTFDMMLFPFCVAFVLYVFCVKILEGKGYNNSLYCMSKVLFYSMAVMEFYSICVVCNEYYFSQLKENSFLYAFVDIFFLFSTIFFLICKKQKNVKHYLCIKKEIRQIKQCIWIVFIVTVAIVCVYAAYVNANEEFLNISFFFGKSIDQGYLITGFDNFFYVQKQVEEIGGLMINPSAYQFTDLSGVMMYQKAIVYLMQLFCSFLYDFSGVLFILLLKVCYMAIKNMGRKSKRKVALNKE